MSYHVEAARVLRGLSEAGVEIGVTAEGRLRYRIPPGLPRDETVERLRFVKAHVLELLDSPCPACDRIGALCAEHYEHPAGRPADWRIN